MTNDWPPSEPFEVETFLCRAVSCDVHRDHKSGGKINKTSSSSCSGEVHLLQWRSVCQHGRGIFLQASVWGSVHILGPMKKKSKNNPKKQCFMAIHPIIVEFLPFRLPGSLRRDKCWTESCVCSLFPASKWRSALPSFNQTGVLVTMMTKVPWPERSWKVELRHFVPKSNRSLAADGWVWEDFIILLVSSSAVGSWSDSPCPWLEGSHIISLAFTLQTPVAKQSCGFEFTVHFPQHQQKEKRKGRGWLWHTWSSASFPQTWWSKDKKSPEFPIKCSWITVTYH